MEAHVTQAFTDLGTLLIFGAGVSLMLRAKRMAARFFVCAILSIVCGVVGPEVVNTVPIYVWIALAALVALALFRVVLALFVSRNTADIATGNLTANLMTFALYGVLLSFKGLRRLFSPGLFDEIRSKWTAPVPRSREPK